MSFPEYIDLCGDDDAGEANVKTVKREPDVVAVDQEVNAKTIKQEPNLVSVTTQCKSVQQNRFETDIPGQGSEENRTRDPINVAQSSYSVLNQRSSVDEGSSPDSVLHGCSEPLCRQFWKAGDYDVGRASKTVTQNGKSHLRVHPKFLHSNATSHKWVLGAIAELLDNAVDEIQNGATFVVVDKISNPRNGSPALLIQDDGGGMDPESMRCCMSFGFSEKNSKSAIGQYGNGFKTSTMRLGADAIVFSRHMNKRALTQSVGLLSYTFLTQTGHDDIVVPMVDYEFNQSTGAFRTLLRSSQEHFSSNLSVLLQWSPYATEAELLKQFDDIGTHGTKVIVYNLWFTDQGDLELDFTYDAEDILISGAPTVGQTRSTQKLLNHHHVSTKFRYSLRVYSSILYLRLPETFKIILRGQVVEHYNIASDLKFLECILYRPKVTGNKEVAVITTIGFLKDAPHINAHGFNVYHKNRLIVPFWRVLHQGSSKGRGVVGVLEANFIEPTHDKQDFEKTSLLQKLEIRLKEMASEYWDLHCGLIGYCQLKKPPSASHPGTNSVIQPVVTKSNSPAIDSSRVALGGVPKSPAITSSHFSAGRPDNFLSNHQTSSQSGFPVKRKQENHMVALESAKRQAGAGVNATEPRYNHETKAHNNTENQHEDHLAASSLIQENKKLRAQCSEYEKSEEELKLKVQRLQRELQDVRNEYQKMLIESESIDTVKVETGS